MKKRFCKIFLWVMDKTYGIQSQVYKKFKMLYLFYDI